MLKLKLQYVGHLMRRADSFEKTQSRFDARYWMLGAGALGRPRGMVWGGRREEGSGWGTQFFIVWFYFGSVGILFDDYRLKK